MKRFIILSLILTSYIANAQETELDFKTYLEKVSRNNLEYAAQKYNVNISGAAIESAKVFPDPSLSFGWSQSKDGKVTTGNEYSVELGKTIELGGKRKARIDLAKSNVLLSKAQLDDYFRNLRAEAALVYLEAIKQQSLYQVKNDSWKVMKQLAESDSIRLKLGSIMEIDAIQSKLEAGIQFNDLVQAEAEWKNALTRVELMMGKTQNDTLYSPKGSLDFQKRNFQIENLIVTAQNNRADLMAALYNKEVSQKSLQLARKERSLDIDLNLGYGKNYPVPSGSATESAITGGLAIPLKFSNYYKGEIKMAQFQILQADNLYKQAELQIRSGIRQAFQQYDAYCKQSESFDNGLLEKAQKVRQGKIYSYNRGETSLLEVLNAQRIYNDTQSDYIETLYNRAAALVTLEKEAGIWDINF